MPENVDCNICKSKAKTVMFTVDKLGIVRCKGCGLIYTTPRPTEKESEKIYKDFNVNYDGRSLRVWTDTAKRRFSEITRFKKNGTILEIGCSIGYFLNEAKKHGFECYGIDASENAIRVAKKLYGLNNVSSKNNYMNLREKFDVIAAYHVLEHMSDPVAVVKKLSSALKKDGILVLEVPDVGSLKPKILKSKWVAYDAYRHLYYFNHRSLAKILAANNLRIIKKVSVPNILLSEFGAKQEAAIRALPAGTRNILSKASLYGTFLMRKMGLGDAIRVYAVKK